MRYLKTPILLFLYFVLPSLDATAQLTFVNCRQSKQVTVRLPTICFTSPSDSHALVVYQKMIVQPGITPGMPACASDCPPNQICFLQFRKWDSAPPTPAPGTTSGTICVPGGARTITVGCSRCLCDLPPPDTSKPDTIIPFPPGNFLRLANQPESLLDVPSPFQDVNIYPSPVADVLKVDIQIESSIAQLKMVLFDLQGRRMEEWGRSSIGKGLHRERLQVGHLPMGQYILMLYDGERSMEGRQIIISR